MFRHQFRPNRSQCIKHNGKNRSSELRCCHTLACPTLAIPEADTAASYSTRSICHGLLTPGLQRHAEGMSKSSSTHYIYSKHTMACSHVRRYSTYATDTALVL
jgi:hypothetical protein